MRPFKGRQKPPPPKPQPPPEPGVGGFAPKRGEAGWTDPDRPANQRPTPPPGWGGGDGGGDIWGMRF